MKSAIQFWQLGALGSNGLGLRGGGVMTVAVDSRRSRAVVSTEGGCVPAMSVTNVSLTWPSRMIRWSVLVLWKS
jgi:hypothetical protein